MGDIRKISKLQIEMVETYKAMIYKVELRDKEERLSKATLKLSPPGSQRQIPAALSAALAAGPTYHMGTIITAEKKELVAVFTINSGNQSVCGTASAADGILYRFKSV